jgi:hypothetical protein
MTLAPGPLSQSFDKLRMGEGEQGAEERGDGEPKRIGKISKLRFHAGQRQRC